MASSHMEPSSSIELVFPKCNSLRDPKIRKDPTVNQAGWSLVKGWDEHG